MPKIIGLRCRECGAEYELQATHVCEMCFGPLDAVYDDALMRKIVKRERIESGPKSMWRYRDLLPIEDSVAVVTLGEGMTPLVHAKRLGASLGLANLYVKDEGLNPTGSFKARGMSAAVTRARQLGVKALAAPTAGNAGGALAAYAAAAGMAAVIVMPADTPSANVMECQAFGAKVVKLNGLISDCGKYVAENKDREGWYDVSTLKEPYRVEGKKTMGYELWEQFGGKLPHVIFYPTGGGVGLIGMCKAFDELQQMGRIGGERPRMVAVQAEGCAPIVKAWEAHQSSAQFFPNAATIASGLRVPWPLGDQLILSMLRQTRGTAVSVTDNEMLHGGRELASLEGILAAPEGAATVVAARILAGSGWIKPHETVVLFNTGTGYKYSEAWQKALQA